MGISELPVKQMRFVDEYLVDLNATQGAIRAGYSKRSARQIASGLLSKHYIQAVIQHKCKETEARLQVTRDDVIRGLLEACQDARQQGDPGAIIRAYREIGLMLGYYAREGSATGYFPREQESSESMSIRMHGMTDSELLSL